ncbi:hypothetical protein TwortDSMZ_154 [Staphylococcus phage Twort]|uniref:Uncharacterized protein n=2 Tax=Staphylococcus phage Twort (strain DSM 17442 / HER 48) TaxID=2908167 RepID=A0A6H0X5M2_BPTWO|nr:ORF112 [Staphylococcus phage Twort]AAX92404.1 ORF112 [Staphylococcus phage Twort]QIW89152.1 hypothetical protein TwortDSMZ_154 [Staphylococcus phage Twort]
MNNLIDDNIKKVKRALVDTNSLDIVPEPYLAIASKFKKVREKGESVILEEAGFPHTNSTIMYIDYVSDRWVLGYSYTKSERETVKIPRTIHYSDIYVTDKSHKVNVIFEGENPYE